MTTRNDVVGTFNNYADEQDKALADEKSAHNATKVTLQDTKTQLASLQATYDAHMSTHQSSGGTTPPPETQPTGFLVGMAYGGNADPAPSETRMGVKVEIRRTYYGNSTTEVDKSVTHIKANIAAGRRSSEVSYKVPVSWASAATGGADAWFKGIVAKLVAISQVAAKTHLVKVIVNHEPENDTGTNVGSTTAGRDAWKAMQSRFADLTAGTPLEFGPCLMGWHSFNGTAEMKALWNPDACIPKNRNIKFCSWDIYEKHGPNLDGTNDTGWTNWDSYLQQIKAFCDKRTAEGYPIVWGMSEWGCTEQCEIDKPGHTRAIIDKMVQYGGKWSDYFNTTLNSSKKWAMDPGDKREVAYGKAIKEIV